MDIKTKYKAKKIRAVFFDIDDTLRVKKTGYIPASITKVFKSLQDKGILTGIATGRGMYGVVPEIRELDPDYFITLNGAYVIDKSGDKILDNPIKNEMVIDYVDWCCKENIEYGFAGKDDLSVSADTALVRDAIEPVYPNTKVDAEFYKNHSVYQMWTFENRDEDLELPESLSSELRLVRWHEHSSDVVKVGVSKASGLEQLLEHIGLKAENVLFFGDGENDLEMFNFVGLKIAMGNAIQDLKDKADYVTSNVEEDGILKALEELGLVDKELNFPQLDLEKIEGPVAVIKTNLGNMTVKLFPEQAPKTVANFIALAKEGYYDGVIFHRIIEDFMIQGGDPTGTGMGGSSIYGEKFEDEFSEELYNIKGALSMANAGPNTNGSQFFIVQNHSLPYSKKELVRGGWPEQISELYASKGGTPHLDRRHTVFGQLFDRESYDVLDKIANVETNAHDKPLEDVVIETIEVRD